MRPLLAHGLLADGDAGAVDKALQAAEFLQRQRYRSLAVGFRGDVSSDKSRLTQLFGQCIAGIGVDIGDDDLAARLRNGARRCRTQTGCTAGDNKRAVLEFHLSLPRLPKKFDIGSIDRRCNA
jgi:hypothetical protein